MIDDTLDGAPTSSDDLGSSFPGVDPAPVPEANPDVADPDPAKAVPGDCRQDSGDPALLAQQLSEVLRGVDGLREAVTHQLSERSRFLENTVRAQQTRIEALQGDQVRAALMPVFQKLVIILSDLATLQNSLQSDGADLDPTAELESFRALIEEALSLMGTESVGARPGVPFDRSCHSARRRVKTDDPTDDGLVAAVIRQGLVDRRG